MTPTPAPGARIGLRTPLRDQEPGLTGTVAPARCLRAILSDPATAPVKA